MAPVDADTMRGGPQPDDRYRVLSEILEQFTASLDIKEVLRRIVTLTRERFGADRAWLLHPISEDAETSRVRFAVNAPGFEFNGPADEPLPLGASKQLIRRALESDHPIVTKAGLPELDETIAKRFDIRSQIVQILRPIEGAPWAFGMHQCSADREWSAAEIALFGDIGRYATIALNNTLVHEHAARELEKAAAILDLVPEETLIINLQGRIERMNAAAIREWSEMVVDGLIDRDAASPRYLDGRPVPFDEAPHQRALRGENVDGDYLLRVPKTNGNRVVNVRAMPIRDGRNRIAGAIILARDITDDRQTAERETWRRRRAEALANLGVEVATLQPTFDDLNEPARRIAQAIDGTVRIYFYRPHSGLLELVGFAGTSLTERFRDYFLRNPYRIGEGMPGTVLQIGRPLFFYDIRGDAVVDFARDEKEKSIKRAMDEQSLIATPIEAYGERIGALVISQSDPNRNFDAEDLEFTQAIAERVGAANHIHQLTRVSLDGHRAAEELARHEVDARVRFEAVIETAPIGIAVVSADELRFEMANARWVEFASYFGKIAPDTRVIGLRGDEVIPGWEKAFKQVAESGETRFDEALQIATHPSPVYVNRIISAVRGRFSGITQSLTVLVQDVTDQVVAKREIEALAQMMAERSARLHSILGSMTDALWVYDANGAVVDVNQAALTMFGLGSRTEAIEHGSFEKFHLRYPDGRVVPRDDLPYARALSGMIVPDYLAIGRHLISGKDLDLSIAAAPIESNGIVGAVLVMRDITALQELDRKKDEFLSVASHELRTPLTTIKGYTQLLAQTIDDLAVSDRTTYLNAVLGEIERMMGLITELLDVSRIETNRLQIDPQPIRWRDFLERRASAFRVQNPARRITFSASSIGDSTLVIDPDRMRQVIDNLISNAIKYSPENTEIELRATIDEHDMLTEVIDSGIGIPRDEIPRLFERFHRARNVSSRYYGGLGLGLYIAKAIIEAHQGSISVVSEEGQGATFTVRLPLHGTS